MDRFDRIYKLHGILASARYPVPMSRLMDEMDCSRATMTRILEDLRGFLGAPVVYQREGNGYVYQKDGEKSYELPGLWFNSRELCALAACQELLMNLGPGILRQSAALLSGRIEKIFTAQGLDAAEVAKRVRLLRIGFHDPDEAVFGKVAEGTLRRKRLSFTYHGRASGRDARREVSPQRIGYYRDNWYLDAFCHLRKELRTFSLDRIRDVEVTGKTAQPVPEAALDAHFASSYGIFAGKPNHVARLRFSPAVAEWVSRENWHPAQRGKMTPDGHYELEIPYSDSRELTGDILRYGPDVEAVGPESLRREVAERLKKAADLYG